MEERTRGREDERTRGRGEEGKRGVPESRPFFPAFLPFIQRNTLGLTGLALFVLVAILPIGFSLAYAAAYSLGWVGLLSEGFTFAYWAKVAAGGEVWGTFGWSLYVATVTVVLTVGLALVLALYLRRPLQHGPLSYVIYFPLALPATVAAFLVFQLFSGAGYLARVALALGLIESAEQFPSAVHDPYGVGIILAHVGITVPFFILLFIQVYNTEKVGALMQLARTLGARRRDTVYRVAVPILLQKAATNVLLLFIAVLGSYEIPLLLGRQSPEMLSVLTMRKYSLFDLSQKPEAFIVALLYTAFVLALLILAFRRGRVAYDH